MTGASDMIILVGDIMSIFTTAPMSYFIGAGLVTAAIGIFAAAKKASES